MKRPSFLLNSIEERLIEVIGNQIARKRIYYNSIMVTEQQLRVALEPGPQAQLVTHLPEYVYSQQPGLAKPKRMIFHNVEYTPKEVSQIQQLRQALAQLNDDLLRPDKFNDPYLLRFFYAGNCNLADSISRIKEQQLWPAQPPSELGFGELKRGVVYVLGKDRQCRPVIVLNVREVRAEVPIEEYLRGLDLVMRVTQKHGFLPGKVQNWVILIDLANAGVLDFQIDLIKTMIGKIAGMYPGTLHKMFILRPSFLARTIWRAIKLVIHPETLQKIAVIGDDDIQELHACIDPSNLEVKYSGKLPSPECYWPPRRVGKGQEEFKDFEEWDMSFYTVVNDRNLLEGALPEQQCACCLW